MQRTIVNILGVVLTLAVYTVMAVTMLSAQAYLVIAVVGMLLLIPLVVAGRAWLDSEPTVEKAREVTTYVHYLLAIFFGAAIIAAVRMGELLPVLSIPTVNWLAVPLMFLSTVAVLLVMLNLFLKGMGAPIAAALTRVLATQWFYAWTRNPMILAAMAAMVGLGLWLRSGLFLLWLLILVVPAVMIFVKVYEERELEIRFGRDYMDYKERTPMMIPRRPK